MLCVLYGVGEAHANQRSKEIPDLVYYDADTIKIKNKFGEYELNGHAALILGNLFFSADKIIIEKNENFIIAEGNVRAIYKKTQATASKIMYDGITKQLRMDNAKIYSDPNSTENLFEQNALGLSKAEIAFEQNRQKREQEILKELGNIRIAYAHLKNLLALKKDQNTLDKIKILEDKYAQLLAHHLRISSEPNVPFSELSENERAKYLERRTIFEKFSKEYPDAAEKILNFSTVPSYIYVSASKVIQKTDDTYLLNDTFLTPCNCGTTAVPPIFRFSAQKAELDLGNYVTMEGSTFDLFKVPVLYLPWSKLSIKNKRETGFLYPSGYLSNNAGFSVTFPFFLTLGEHADSTTSYQYFSERGSRIEEQLRIAFFENSMLFINGNISFDRLYHTEWTENKINAENAISATESNPNLTPAEKSAQIIQYNEFIGKPLNNRWYAESSWNIPLLDNFHLKFNGEITSDNTYISDFEPSTNVDPMSSVYGNTTSASRRFLNQEADAEYYGNHVVFSARSTRYQDLFALTTTNAPASVPLLELTLLPNKYFGIPIEIANKSTFEDIIGAQTITGKRLGSSFYFTFNLYRNKYFNSYFQVQEAAVQYYSQNQFELSSPINQNPYEIYSKISFRTEIPFYAKTTYKNDKSEITIKNNLKPFVDLSYIPTVYRSHSFPYTYKLWYAADNIAKEAMITVGTTWDINIKKGSSELSKKVKNIVQSHVADIKILKDIVDTKKDASLHSDAEPFVLPTDAESTQIYTQWANLELTKFYAEMQKSEFNQTDFVPNLDEKSDFDFTPIRFSLFSNYNIIAKQTADELNKIAGPFFSPQYVSQPFGDLSAKMDWNLLPFIGWDGSVLYSYSFAYRRLNTLTTSTNIALAYGFAGLARYQILYSAEPPSETINPDIFNGPFNFVRKTFLNFGLSYSPKPFVKVGFEWAINTDPTMAQTTDLSNGRQYGSSFYINFLHLQDCLDILIARNKPAGIPETQATYSIGINVKFFGHGVSFNQIGNYLNSKLQH